MHGQLRDHSWQQSVAQGLVLNLSAAVLPLLVPKYIFQACFPRLPADSVNTLMVSLQTSPFLWLGYEFLLLAPNDSDSLHSFTENLV